MLAAPDKPLDSMSASGDPRAEAPCHSWHSPTRPRSAKSCTGIGAYTGDGKRCFVHDIAHQDQWTGDLLLAFPGLPYENIEFSDQTITYSSDIRHLPGVGFPVNDFGVDYGG